MEAVTRNATKSEGSSDLILAKAVAMCVLGIGSFAIGILPIKLTKWINIKSVDGDKNLLISLLLCFGGGVLLFTTFVHLQPEVRESFMMLESHDKIPSIGSGIPMSELVFCFGFFFVYLIEEVVHLFLDRKLDDDSLHRSLSIRCSNKKRNLTIPRVTLNKFDDGNISYISTSNKELLNSQSTINFDKHSHSHNIDAALKNSFSGLLAVLALSFHAVFEGLAVGLEGDVQRVWYLFAAIATHKLVIAFCVGFELVTSKTKLLLVLLYIGTFAVVTPLGIGIGLVLTESHDSHEDVASIVLQGMAAGTLLYVVFFEVLARERGNHHSGVWQLFAILLGFAVMFCLQILTGHEHSHGGAHSHDHEHAEHFEVTTHHHHEHIH
ncbi:zinc transporter ZIP1-like [Zophobas morio]|uniref:zinc transporter ZIP1-like n=1 Tax=Zophobas morio TaxID=2755281 RepID=UPI003083178A